MNCYQYPRPALTVDAVVFRKNKNATEVLLIRRKFPPYRGRWALPGGFVEMDETLDDAVRRELKEETGMKDVDLQQLHTFGDPGRDPRGRTVSVIYWGFAGAQNSAVAGDDAARAEWFDLSALPELAFDHDRVVEMAVERMELEVR